MSVLYRTTAVNQSGISGVVEITHPNKQQWQISSPLTAQSGTNPEQLLAASVATCLHASLRYVLEKSKQVVDTAVTTQVDLLPDEEGYQFAVLATIHFAAMNKDEAIDLVEASCRQCPLAKLIPTLQIMIEVEE